MTKHGKGKIIFFLLIFTLAVIGGIVIQEYDNRYRNFFIEKEQIGEVVSEDTITDSASTEETSGDKVYVNINTDNAQELMQLDGIGETMAKRIITYRKEHGDFEVVEDLMRVSGIGTKKFDNIKENIYVQ
ncbi:MAG: helix-hairpin-helix domain-containing protein [Clostridia bacterium]|nr:helix-hairpin-helix domain-containing protein [Clostridia bacterium]